LRPGCADARFDRPDRKPAAFVVYLHLYGEAARNKWRRISASVRTIADATGISKSAVQAALTFATPTTNRDDRRSRHCYSAPSHSASLAHATTISTTVKLRQSVAKQLPRLDGRE